jgi:hypothetical protein
MCFCSSGAFKTYNNLWGGENQVIPTEWVRARVIPSQVRAVPEPKHG